MLAGAPASASFATAALASLTWSLVEALVSTLPMSALKVSNAVQKSVLEASVGGPLLLSLAVAPPLPLPLPLLSLLSSPPPQPTAVTATSAMLAAKSACFIRSPVVVCCPHPAALPGPGGHQRTPAPPRGPARPSAGGAGPAGGAASRRRYSGRGSST